MIDGVAITLRRFDERGKSCTCSELQIRYLRLVKSIFRAYIQMQ